jgi:hypothetical protein
VPFTSGVFPFTVLDLAVLRDEREQFVRQGDLTASGSRFEIRLDQAAVASLWAPSGMTCTVGRARGWACALVLFAIRLARFCLVITGTARMRVVAPMLPRPPLQRLADSQCLGHSIETRPFEAERFALPDAERQSNDEPDTISLCQSQTQQPVNFLCLEWLNFFFVNSRWLGEVSGISSDAATLKCFTGQS